MTYLDYYKMCAGVNFSYDIKKFTYEVLPFKLDISECYNEIKSELDKVTPCEWNSKILFAPKHLGLLKPSLDIMLDYLEAEIYKCHIFIEQVFIYRSVHYIDRVNSLKYHYDNCPPTRFKNIIYLSDVKTDDDAPIEFCDNFICEPTKQGGAPFILPPNGSRIEDSVANQYSKTRIYGDAGTITTFYPNCIHRATVPSPSKYRDVMNIVTRPTPFKDERYTSINYNSSDTVLVDPTARVKCV